MTHEISPLPWGVVRYPQGPYVADAYGSPVAKTDTIRAPECELKANAAHIVRAATAHAALVVACKAAREELLYVNRMGGPRDPIMTKALPLITAALKLAGED